VDGKDFGSAGIQADGAGYQRRAAFSFSWSIAKAATVVTRDRE